MARASTSPSRIAVTRRNWGSEDVVENLFESRQAALLGLSYSAVNRRVGAVRARLAGDWRFRWRVELPHDVKGKT